MENSEFDQILKDTLSEYNPTAHLPNWNRMKSKLDASIEDKAFDQILKEKLINVDVNVKDASWAAFDQKRQMRRQKRFQILSARLIESFILLLLIWTVNRIVVPEFMEQQKAHHITQAIASTDMHSELENINSNKEISSFYKRNLQPNNRTKKQNTTGVNKSTSTYAHQTNQTNRNIKISKRSKAKTIGGHNVSASFPEELDPFIPSTIDSKTVPVQAIQVQSLVIEQAVINLALDGLKTNILPLELSDRALSYLEPKVISHKRPLTKTWINIHSSGIVNHIKTPKDNLIDLPAHQQTRFGYALGVSMLFDYSNWLLETGITYVNLSSHPNIEETYKNSRFELFKRTFSKAEYHIIDIPIGFHLNWLERSKFDISSNFGMSLSFAAKNHFTIEDVQLPKSSGSSLGNIPKPSLIAEKNFDKGSYANILLGSRISYSTSYDTKIFADVQCKRMLNSFGFGPNYDRFFQGVFTVGAAFRIK